MEEARKNFLKDNSSEQSAFEELYEEQLSAQELFECEQNCFDFFALLYKIQQRELLKQAETPHKNTKERLND